MASEMKDQSVTALLRTPDELGNYRNHENAGRNFEGFPYFLGL